MSPFRSSAGPATVRMPTSSSSRMIVASVVFPRPGGPTSRTWSSASPRPFAASSAIVELLLRALLADEVVESARPQRLLDLLVALAQHRCEELARHAALRSASRTRSSTGRSGSTRGERLLGLDERVPELDERVARDELARSTARPATGTASAIEPSSSSTIRSAVFLPMPGIAWKRAESLERDRALELLRRRARDDGERDLRPDAAHAEELDEQRALGGVGEAVELERVLADVEVRLDRHLGAPSARRSTLGVALTR